MIHDQSGMALAEVLLASKCSQPTPFLVQGAIIAHRVGKTEPGIGCAPGFKELSKNYFPL